MAVNGAEVVVGLLLLFFVPGYALTKATFPEWRIRGRSAILRLLEIVTLSFVLSVVLTVVVGYFLLAASPSGFQAYWSDPALEVGLAVIAAVAFAVGWLRGAYAAEPPPVGTPEGPDERGAWEVSRELERLGREERRLNHQLRVSGSDPATASRLREELDRIAEERAEIQRRREAEYAS